MVEVVRVEDVDAEAFALGDEFEVEQIIHGGLREEHDRERAGALPLFLSCAVAI